jgi:hypothetical protein
MTYSQQAQQQTQSYNKNLGSYFDSITSNYKAELANASRTGESLQLLGEASQVVAGKLQERKNYLTEQAKLKYYNAALDGIEQGKFEITDDPFDTADDRSDKIDLVVDEIRNGMPLEWGERFLGLGDVQNRSVQQAYIAAKTASSINDIKDIISTNGLDVSNNSNVAGSIAAARTQWIQSNFMGFDEDLVINNTPKLLKQTTKLSQSYQKQNNLSRSLDLENQFLVEYQYGTKDWGSLYKQLSLTLNPKTGASRTPGEINDFANAALKNIASQGGFKGEARQKYIDHIPKWGGGKNLGELKASFVSELDTTNLNAQKKLVENYVTQQNINAAQSANEVYQQYNELVRTGNRPNDDWVALKLRDHKKVHGERETELFNSMFTTQELVEGDAVRMLDEEFDKYGFVSEDNPALKHLSRDTYQNYQGVVQPSSQAKELTKLQTRVEEIFEGKLAKNVKTIGALPGTLNDVGAHLKHKVLDNYINLRQKSLAEGDNPQAAHDSAQSETLKEMEPGGKFDIDKADDLFDELTDPKNTDKQKRFTSNVLNWIGNNPNRLPGVEELQVSKPLLDSIQQFNQGIITQPPAEVRNIADRIPGKNAFDVMEVLTAAGGYQITMPPAVKAERALRSVRPDVHRKLQYPTPANTTQAGIDLQANALSYRSPDVSHPAVRNQLDIFSDPHMRAIGLNEGTLNSDGTPTQAYYGHIDVGDGNNNRGIFSGREGSSVEQANAIYYEQVNASAEKYRESVVKFGAPLGSKAYDVLMFNIKDLTIQAPAAVDAFVAQIPSIIDKGISADSVGFARTEAFAVIRDGQKKYDTTFKTYEELLRDQTSRSMTIVTGQRG